MQRWSPSADRTLRAYLRAVVFAEPVQLALLDKYGIRLSELRSLRVLQDLSPTPIGSFADKLGISRSTATGLIDRLEQRGLVCREASTDDRRVTNIRVTDHGVRALEDRDLFRQSPPGQQIAALAEHQQDLLADLLEQVYSGEPVAAGEVQTVS